MMSHTCPQMVVAVGETTASGLRLLTRLVLRPFEQAALCSLAFKLVDGGNSPVVDHLFEGERKRQGKTRPGRSQNRHSPSPLRSLIVVAFSGAMKERILASAGVPGRRQGVDGKGVSRV